MRLLSSGVVFLCLSASLFGQGSVLVVDEAGGIGSDYTRLDTAVNEAQDGDVLLVRQGNYQDFVVNNKDLTIAGEAGATVTFGGSSRTRIENLDAGKKVVLHGLGWNPWALGPGLLIRDCQGSVLLQECHFPDAGTHPFLFEPNQIVVERCESVVLLRCRTEPGAPRAVPASALTVDDSSVYVYDSELHGAKGQADQSGIIAPSPGWPAICVNSGTLLVSGSRVVGGAGGDSTTSSFNGANGGPGLKLGAGQPVAHLVDTDLEGGPGGLSVPPGSSGQPGPPHLVQTGTLDFRPVTVARTLRFSPNILHEGDSTTVTFGGKPGDFAQWVLSLQLNPTLLLSAHGALLPSPPLFSFVVGPLSSSGQLVLSLSAPPLPVGLTYGLVYHQAIFFAPAEGIVLSSGQAVLLVP